MEVKPGGATVHSLGETRDQPTPPSSPQKPNSTRRGRQDPVRMSIDNESRSLDPERKSLGRAFDDTGVRGAVAFRSANLSILK